MIEIIKLQNTGASFLLSYVDDGVEKIIPEISSKAFNHSQGLIAYVEQLRRTEDEKIETLKTSVAQKEQKVTLLTKHLLAIELTDEQMLELIDIYPEWSSESVVYEVNDKVKYNEKLYKVVQGHTSQAGHHPPEASLFKEIAPPGVIAEWVQPTGGDGTYVLGAKVTFEGNVYENIFTVDTYNVWSPTGYPHGWKLIS